MNRDTRYFAMFVYARCPKNSQKCVNNDVKRGHWHIAYGGNAKIARNAL